MDRRAREQEEADRKKAEEIERLQELEDIRAILDTPAGVRFFQRFLKDGHVFHSTFTGNSQGYFLEGQRAYALKYFTDIVSAAPDKIATLIIVEEK